MQNNNYTNFSGSSLNTLAQNGTAIPLNPKKTTRKILVGKGSELANTERIKARSKRKLVGQTFAIKLIAYAEKRGNKELIKALWNTYYCINTVTVSNGRIYGKYCKNLFCPICLAIRKAEILNRYFPTVCQWKEPQLVTLTAKSVPKGLLNERINRGFKRAWKIILQRCKKRYQRGKGIKLIGVKSLECCFNPIERTYNPHFHFIVPDKETAKLLRYEWMKLWRAHETDKWIVGKAQDIRKIKTSFGALREVIKYGSKIFTAPDAKQKDKKQPKKIYIAAHYEIILALRNQRLFERFGFNLPNAVKERIKTAAYETQDYEFDLTQGNWVNTSTGAFLTDYKPTFQLLELLKNNIDSEVA